MFQDGLRLLRAKLVERGGEPGIGGREYGNREQRRVRRASVPTGTPAGICTIDSSESIPCSALDCTGTPSTGNEVFAAIMPGR